MADIDDVLSASLKRLAQPGDPAGVADAIRSRVDAGDTGTPANSSGFTSGVGSWLPWVGLVVVAGLTGASLAMAGVFAVAAPEPPVSQIAITVGDGVGAAGCPGGPTVVNLEHGQRVLAVERTDDSVYLGVRYPSDFSSTVWLPAAVVAIDDGQPAVDSLPVGGCAVAEPLVTAAPVTPVTPVVPVAPGPVVPPAPDTTAPTIGKPTSSIDPVCNTASGSGTHTATISVSASDNVGVTSVAISWSGAESGSASMSGGWSYNYTTTTKQFGALTFTVIAFDAAGNKSPANSVTIQQMGCVGG